MDFVLVIDTNLLVSGDLRPPLTSNVARRLLDGCLRGHYRVVIPELVAKELANKWTERVSEKDRVLRATLRELQDAAVIDAPLIPDLDLEAIRRETTDRIGAELEHHLVEICGWPDVSHEEVVSRALDRRQPFDAKGRDGYRDVLLWECAVQYVEPETVVTLISNDGDAFYENRSVSSGQLSSLLVREVEQRKKRADGLALLTTIETSLDAIDARRAKADQEKRESEQRLLKEALAQLEERLSSIHDYLGQELEHELIDSTMDADVTLLIQDNYALDIQVAKVNMVNMIDHIVIADGYLEQDGSLLATVMAEVSADAVILANIKSSEDLYGPDDLDVRNVDLKKGKATFTTFLPFVAIYDVVFEREPYHPRPRWTIGKPPVSLVGLADSPK